MKQCSKQSSRTNAATDAVDEGKQKAAAHGRQLGLARLDAHMERWAGRQGEAAQSAEGECQTIAPAACSRQQGALGTGVWLTSARAVSMASSLSHP